MKRFEGRKSELIVLLLGCFLIVSGELPDGWVSAGSTPEQTKKENINVLRNYLNYAKELNFGPNYEFLSNNAKKIWTKQGVKNKKEYEQVKSAEEFRLIGYSIEEIAHPSNNVIEVIVKKKTIGENRKYHENKYRFVLVRENDTWKIDGFSDLERKHEHLP